MSRKKRSSQGRKKIAIERIGSEEARHVCFSKRRNGVFTKATDLATLCGAEVAVVVNSPAGNPYSYGSPGVSEVANRFLAGSSVPSSSGSSNSSFHHEAGRMNTIRGLNQQCMELSRLMEMARAKKSMYEARVKALVQSNSICKLSEDTEGLGLMQLKQVEESLKQVKTMTEGRINELMRVTGGATPSNIGMVAANPMKMMDRYAFAFGAGQNYLPSNFGYGRGFY